MLRTNLATRPFYNERSVRVAIGIGVVLTAALTAFNAAEILALNQKKSELVTQAETAEARARDLRTQAQVIRQSLSKDELQAVQHAAREANVLIDRRAFSWTDLFNRFEETLPADIRIVAVAPQVDNDGRMLVAVTLVSKEKDVGVFLDRLEDTGAFTGVLPRQQDVEDDGTVRTVIQGYYNQAGFKPAVSTPPTSDSSGASSNASPGNVSSANVTPPAPRLGAPR